MTRRPDLAGTYCLQINEVYTELEDPGAALCLSGRSSGKSYTIISGLMCIAQISCDALTERGDQINIRPEAPRCKCYHHLLICYCQ